MRVDIRIVIFELESMMASKLIICNDELLFSLLLKTSFGNNLDKSNENLYDNSSVKIVRMKSVTNSIFSFDCSNPIEREYFFSFEYSAKKAVFPEDKLSLYNSLALSFSIICDLIS